MLISHNTKFSYLCSCLGALLLGLSSNCWAIVDTDGDGMSDVWEKLHGAEALLPSGNEDADTFTNLEESIAGTDPFDGTSFFEVSSTNSVSGTFLTWASESAVRYQLQQSTTLKPGEWNDNGLPYTGNGGQLVHQLSNETELQNFYRVKTLLDDDLLNLVHSSIGYNDSDSDGQDDIAELFEGKSPFNILSRREAPHFKSGQGFSITWPTVKGKNYRIEYSDNELGPWVEVQPVYLGSGSSITAIVLNPNISPDYTRVSVLDKDSDSDGVSDWEELHVGFDPESEKTDTLGMGDAPELTVLLSEASLVSVIAERGVANLTNTSDGSFKICRKGGVRELTVNYSIGGTALGGTDYVQLSGVAVIPFGEDSVIVNVTPLAASGISLTESVQMTITAGIDYTLSSSIYQQINIIKEVALNVKDYGAVGDGITDDTSALQSALSALEVSTTHNTLYFPIGQYRLNSYSVAPFQTGTTPFRILHFGNNNMSGRDLFFRGEVGSSIYSTVSPIRAHMLMVMCRFRSLTCYSMTWEKDDVPLTEKYQKEPNGADAVSLMKWGPRYTEAVEFYNCDFINCHGAVWAYGSGFTIRSKLGKLLLSGCNILNPYGANTINSSSAWGGGQQVQMGAWVRDVVYINNVFDGGSEDMTDATVNPGGKMKDGSHFGSPMNLIFKGNVVRRMGSEAIFQTNKNTFLGNTKSSFIVPPEDGTTEVEVSAGSTYNVFNVGDVINIRSQATPQTLPQNSIFTVTHYDPSLLKIKIVNHGGSTNLAPGSFIGSNRSMYRNNGYDPTYATITRNVVEGDIPPGGVPGINIPAGIVVSGRSTISENIVRGYGVGIWLPKDDRTPLFPGAQGTIVQRNYILTRNPTTNTETYTYGIESHMNDEYIASNYILTPVSTHAVGSTSRGANARIFNNFVAAKQIMVNGYSSSVRAVGIAVGEGSKATNNQTWGFDVGVGPETPYGSVIYEVPSHYSYMDVLGIDPYGLLGE